MDGHLVDDDAVVGGGDEIGERATDVDADAQTVHRPRNEGRADASSTTRRYNARISGIPRSDVVLDPFEPADEDQHVDRRRRDDVRQRLSAEPMR